jgi:hypothetical protein
MGRLSPPPPPNFEDMPRRLPPLLRVAAAADDPLAGALAATLPAREREWGPLLRVALMSAAVGAGLMYSTLQFTVAPPARLTSADPASRPAAAPAATPVTQSAPVAVPAIAGAASGGVADRATGGRAHDEAIATVRAWAEDWARRDVEAYLAHYAPQFAPDQGVTRAEWEAKRRKRLAAVRKISVVVREPRAVSIDADRVAVRFAQDYSADGYRETATPKTLVLVRADAGWKITAEAQDERAPAGPAPRSGR